MPLDAILISALQTELDAVLSGGRIDKIQQPERDMLLISLRSAGTNRKLLVSVGTGSARVHLTERSFENPQEPPMFCMLMRKHLTGAHIISVTQPENERLLQIKLSCFDELGVQSEKLLIVEMIGRSSNLILVGSDGRIIDCMRRMDFAGDAVRRMLPGMIYRLPPKQNKADFLSTEQELCLKLCREHEQGTAINKWLLDSFSGLSPLVCRELEHRCGGSWENLPATLDALRETVQNREFSYNTVELDGKLLDYSFMVLSQYGKEAVNISYASCSEMLDSFYGNREKLEIRRRRSHELTRTVRTARDRLQRKLLSQQQELQRTELREDVRKKAELITANIYRIKKGDRVLVCSDYYEPDCPDISIELDALKSPQQNAAAMYKQYNKLKTAREHLTVLVAEGERQLEYLNSVLDTLERAESEADLSAIRRELSETGYLKKQRASSQRKLKPQQPYRYMSDDGYEILAGRNNVQNDELSLRTARRTDLWLHTQKVHGSHVIIRCEGEEIPERTLLQAASIAVYHSQAREGGKTPVDYTMVRNVKKPSGALPGKVIYTDYKTLSVSADEVLVQRLAVK